MATPPSAPGSSTFTPKDYTVEVNFVGVARDDVRTMLQKLQGIGWERLPINDGGKRTPAASGKNEVRYGDGDQVAAEALAKAVEATNFVPRVLLVRDGSLKSNELQLWISR